MINAGRSPGIGDWGLGKARPRHASLIRQSLHRDQASAHDAGAAIDYTRLHIVKNLRLR